MRNLVMALGSCKMKRGIEATKSWVLGKTRVAFQKHLGLHQIAVPRRRHQPLAGSWAPKWISHLSQTLSVCVESKSSKQNNGGVNKKTQQQHRSKSSRNGVFIIITLIYDVKKNEKLFGLVCFAFWIRCDGDVAALSVCETVRWVEDKGWRLEAWNVGNGCPKRTKGKGQKQEQCEWIAFTCSFVLFFFCVHSVFCFDFLGWVSLSSTKLLILTLFNIFYHPIFFIYQFLKG